MNQAPINEKCIIGLPQCGYAFQSSRQAFIAIPNDDDYKLELQILQGLLEEKRYNSYVALEQITPGQMAFCGKICAQIIQSQFCIAILNPSRHQTSKSVKIPNPNVHMEYGLMLGFHKYVLPFQHGSETLPFNVSPLDTIKYTNANFKQKANDAIDQAILSVGELSGAPKRIANQRLVEYIAICGLRLARINNADADALYKIGEPLGYSLLDGRNIVYFGLFDTDLPTDVLFKAKLLVQALNSAREEVEERYAEDPDERARLQNIVAKIRIAIVVEENIDTSRLEVRLRELTASFWSPPVEFLTMQDIEGVVQRERDAIGPL